MLTNLGLKNLIFINTSAQTDPTAPPHKKRKPDVSTYCFDSQLDDITNDTYSESPKREETSSKWSMSELLLPFVSKRGDHDPFNDHIGTCPKDWPHLDFESGALAHKETCSQLAFILNEMFACTSRTHAFSIYMNSNIARLLRADRAGILVSEAFNYRKNPNILVDFLLRFDSATPCQRGLDTTVTRSEKVPGNQPRPGLFLSVPRALPRAGTLLSTHFNSESELNHLILCWSPQKRNVYNPHSI